MVSVLLIDNYDSFTWNLVQLLRESGLCSFKVSHNDAVSAEDCSNFDKILISPGPGLPHGAGITCEVIKRWSEHKSILGVCLGHQAIGVVFGAQLKRLSFPKHGSRELSVLTNTHTKLFRNIPARFQTGHYHSWVLNPENFPESLLITAEDNSGNIMAITHKTFDVHGVQFHPESIMTGYGKQMISNWLAG